MLQLLSSHFSARQSPPWVTPNLCAHVVAAVLPALALVHACLLAWLSSLPTTQVSRGAHARLTSRIHTFTPVLQVADLGRQLYVWVGGAGGAGAAMGSLTLAASLEPRAVPQANGVAAAALPNGAAGPSGARRAGSGYDSLGSAAPRAPPAATTLLRSGGGAAAAEADGLGASLARRLALRLNRPVAVAWGVPGGAPHLAAWAERRLLEELASLQVARAGAALSLSEPNS